MNDLRFLTLSVESFVTSDELQSMLNQIPLGYHLVNVQKSWQDRMVYVFQRYEYKAISAGTVQRLTDVLTDEYSGWEVISSDISNGVVLLRR